MVVAKSPSFVLSRLQPVSERATLYLYFPIKAAEAPAADTALKRDARPAERFAPIDNARRSSPLKANVCPGSLARGVIGGRGACGGRPRRCARSWTPSAARNGHSGTRTGYLNGRHAKRHANQLPPPAYMLNARLADRYFSVLLFPLVSTFLGFFFFRKRGCLVSSLKKPLMKKIMKRPASGGNALVV
ncbi:hypothetical protein ISCGN_004989 [Ixodes scapularis]